MHQVHLTPLLFLCCVLHQSVRGEQPSEDANSPRERSTVRSQLLFSGRNTPRARWEFKDGMTLELRKKSKEQPTSRGRKSSKRRRPGRRKVSRGRKSSRRRKRFRGQTLSKRRRRSLGLRSRRRRAERCPDSLRVSNSFALEGKSGTIAAALNHHAYSKNALRNLLGWFQRLDRNLKSRDPKRGDKWMCHRFHGFQDVQEEVASFGWKKMNRCTLGIRPDTQLPNIPSAREAFDTIRAFHDSTASYGKPAAESYGLNWGLVKSAGVLDHEAQDKYRRCKLVRALAYRLNGTWATTALYTNFSLPSEPAFRGILKEVISLDAADRASAVPIKKAVCTADRPRRYVDDQTGTGVLRVISGHVKADFFTFKNARQATEELRGTLPVHHALEAGDFEKEMVEDSDTFSNLAILLLPVVLALVPIALFQDTSTITTVLYAIATDVVSVMPIAIKGLELVVYGSQSHYKASHFLFGIPDSSPTAVVSSWAAECSMKPFVRRKGTILLAVAISAMMFGVVLEFVARRCIHRRAYRKRWRDSVWKEHEAFLRQAPKGEMGLKRSNSVEVASPAPFGGQGGFFGYYGDVK